MVIVLMTSVFMPVSALVMGVPAQVKVWPRIVTLRSATVVPMMHVRKAQALVGQHQEDEKQCEKPANHGKSWVGYLLGGGDDEAPNLLIIADLPC